MFMKRGLTVMLLAILTAGTQTEAADGVDPSRSSGVRPAVKKELPWLNVPRRADEDDALLWSMAMPTGVHEPVPARVLK
jgi:hypothetical protein